MNHLDERGNKHEMRLKPGFLQKTRSKRLQETLKLKSDEIQSSTRCNKILIIDGKF